MTMIELDQTTAEELSEFLVDGELDVDYTNVIDIMSTIDKEWYFNDELQEMFHFEKMMEDREEMLVFDDCEQMIAVPYDAN
jgi:hypothetical protein